MHIGRSCMSLGQSLAVLTLALVGCGGSSGASPTAATTASATVGSGSGAASAPAASPPGSSGGSGGTGGGTSAATTTIPTTTTTIPTTTTILFQQPQESGITGHLLVPTATHTAPSKGAFELVLWQPNPYVSNGELVPTTWDAGAQTGFTPSSPLSTTQLGFQNKVGTSTAQMGGDIVGAYLNSNNLPSSPAGQKMMITPQFIFEPGTEPVPFASSNSSLRASMDLQIPTAVGADTYVVADLLFTGPNGVRVSYGVVIFHNGQTRSSVGSGYDAPSNSYMINSPLGVDQRFVAQVQGSASFTGTPWLGWQHFEWSISPAQFVAALNYLDAEFPGKVQSTDPTQYVLAQVHLNAEFHFQPAPAELGWSMRGWTVWTTG